MTMIVCPDTPDLISDDPWVFLAGGITGCPDWQAAFGLAAARIPVTLINPRRETFDIADPNMSDEQVEWEYHYLNAADTIVFWFPEVSAADCPIALYELGAHTLRQRYPNPPNLIVGAHPEYRRRFDVIKQTSLRCPDLVVHDELSTMVDELARLYPEPTG